MAGGTARGKRAGSVPELSENHFGNSDRTGLVRRYRRPLSSSTMSDTRKAGHRPHRVLIVDDDALIRGMLRDVARHAGFAVATARDGIEAIHTMTASPPDAVITDMDMPRCDGLDFCRELRQTPRWSRTPVVVLTALPMSERRVRQVAQLPDVIVIRKPCRLDQLMLTVGALSRDHQQRRSSTVPSAEDLIAAMSEAKKATSAGRG